MPVLSPEALAINNSGQSPAEQQVAFSTLNKSGGTYSSEPSVVSTDGGNKVLKSNIDSHNADMALATPPAPSTPSGKTGKSPAISDATKQAVIAQGGKTADEASAVGVTPQQLASDYTYDINTGYYLPKNTTTEKSANDNFTAEVEKANTQFATMQQGMDAANSQLVNSLMGLYNSRLAEQKDINARYEAGINTENIRGGTSRYAPGVAGSIFTAAENYGIQKLNTITSELASKLAEANSNLQDKKYTAFIANRAEYDKLKTERDTQIKDLHTAAVKKEEDDRNYKLDVQKFQETKDQNAFDRALKVEQQKIDREKIAAQYGTPSLVAPIRSTVGMTAAGTPDPVGQKNVVDEITAHYGPMTAQAVKGLVDYSRLPTDFPVNPRKGSNVMSRADAVSLAQRLDPTYTETGAPARQAYIKSLQAGPIYNATISANKAINHLVSFSDTVSKLGNVDPWSSSNKISQAIRQPFSSDLQTNISKAETEATGLKDELGKFFKGTGATDVKSIEDWGKNLDTGANPAHLKGTVQGAIDLFAGQMNVMNQSYTNTMGKQPEGAILQPEAISKLSDLKNKGYTVDIPGVYYTNPTIYANKAPENAAKLAEVRTSHPELTPAQATQLAQYLQEHGQ